VGPDGRAALGHHDVGLGIPLLKLVGQLIGEPGRGTVGHAESGRGSSRASDFPEQKLHHLPNRSLETAGEPRADHASVFGHRQDR
jgi:hypothetical protein